MKGCGVRTKANGAAWRGEAQPRDGFKRCSRCKVTRPVEMFSKDKSSPGGLHYHCKLCRSASSRESQEHRRWYFRKKRYGLGKVEYLALFQSQGGHCALCDSTGHPTWGLVIDHDHITGAVRGLLCSRCNSLISGLEKEADVAKILTYLGGKL